MSGVEIRVRSDSTQARRDLARLEKSVSSIESTANSVTKAFRNIAITAGTLYSISTLSKSLTRASDSVTNLENRIALVTGRGRELNTTMRRLAQISANTRVSMSTTSEVFNRFGLALQDASVSADELLQVTRTINQAVTISGASSESARAAIIQFGQGLASGQLRGQELNSVLEQTPRIARAIADGLSIPFGQLRDAAQDGKLTTEAVLRAVQQAAPEINKEFQLIAKTVDSVSNALRYEFKRTLDVIATETGFSDAVIRGIERMTSGFKYFADNARTYLNFVIIDFILFKNRIEGIIEPFTNTFKTIFSTEFDPKQAAADIINKFDEFKTLVKSKISFDFFDETSEGKKVFDFEKFFGQFEIPPSFTKTFETLESTFNTFVENVKKLYKELFGGKTKDLEAEVPVIKASLISDPQKTVDDKGAFDRFLSKLLDWANTVIGVFTGVSNFVVETFGVISTKITEIVGELGGFDNIVSSFKTTANGISEAVVGYAESLDKYLGVTNKFKSINELLFGTDSSEQASKLTKAAKEIEDYVLGKEVGHPGVDRSRKGGVLDNTADFVKENPLLTGAAFATGTIAMVFPQTTLAALKLAGIGLGLAAVGIMAETFKKGFPIAFIVTAISFLPEVDEQSQQPLYDFVYGFTEGLKALLSGEGIDEADAGANFANKIITAFSTIGDAIIDSIVGKDSDFTGKFLDALAGSILAVGTLALLGIGSFGGYLKLLGGAITLGVFSLSPADDEKAAKAAQKKIKSILGKAFAGLFVGDIVGSTVENALNKIDFNEDFIAELKVKEQDLKEIFKDSAEGAAIGLVAGFSLGGGPIGGFVGTIIGGFVGALTSPSVVKVLYAAGKNIYQGFIDALFGKDAVEDAIEIANVDRLSYEIDSLNKVIKDQENVLEGIKTGIIPESKQAAAQLKLQTATDQLTVKQDELRNSLDKLGISHDSIVGKNAGLSESVENATRKIDKLSEGLDNLQNNTFLRNAQTRDNRDVVGFASGGFIRGAGGPRDDKIPAMLSNGEYVINAASTAKHGSLIRAINEDRLPKFANGGDVTATAPLGWDIYNDLNDITVYDKAAFKRRLSLFDFNANYIDKVSSVLAALADLTKQLTSARGFYKPSNIYDYLFSFAKKNSLGPSGNEDRSLKTDNLSFGTTLSDSPHMEQGFKRLSVNTNTASYKDFDALYEQADNLYSISNKSGLDAFKGYDDKWQWEVGWDILGWKAYDATNFSDAYFNFVDRDSHYALLEGYSTLKDRLFDSIGKTYSELGFESFDSAVTAMSGGYTSKQLKDHAFSVINGLRETYKNFYGKNLQVEEDAEAAGVNAWFWQGDKDQPATLGLMSFSSQDPGKFLIAYYAALHEVGHAYDYLKDTKDTFFNDKWPSRFTTPIDEQNYRRLINETDANLFARRTLLPNMDKDFVSAAVHFSQGSYLNSNLESALKQNANLFKEYPEILGVLKDSYNFDLRKLATEDMKREYIKDAILAQWFRGNEINADNEKTRSRAIDAKDVWENIIKPNLDGHYYHEEKFDMIKKLKRSIGKVKRFATGGYITGEGGPTDDKIPAMLSNGEFVVRSSMAKKFRPVLEAINTGSFGLFAQGTPTQEVFNPATGKTVKIKVSDLKGFEDAVREFENANRLAGEASRRFRELSDNLEDGESKTYALDLALQAYKQQKDLAKAATDSLNYFENKLSTTRKKSAEDIKKSIETKRIQDLVKSGSESAQEFKNEFQRGLTEAFKTGDFDAFGESILDSFTTGVLDQFTSGLTDTIFKDLIGKADEDGNVKTPKILDKIFGGSKELGQTGEVSKELGTTSSDLLSVIKDIPKLFSGIFKGFGENLGKVFGNIGSIFSGGSLGLGGGSGGLGTLLNMGLSFFGLPAFPFSNGGIVPNTSFSKRGIDSVPAMLTPGELVVPADKVKGFTDGAGRSEQVFNINVSGDVSRQTRKEIVRMIPQITSGVNMTNKENNYKRS